MKHGIYMAVISLLLCSSFLLIGASDKPLNDQSPTPAEPIKEPESATTQNQKEAETDQRITKEFPAIIEISKTPTIQVETTDKTQKQNDYTSAEWWSIYITGFLVIITGALALYTARLWKSTQKLVETNEDTAQRQLRAYINLAETGASDNTIITNAPAYLIKLKNTGQTPAYDVKTWTGIGLHEYPLKKVPPPLPGGAQDSSVILAANCFHFARAQFNQSLSEDAKMKIASGKYAITVWGKVEYRDAFDYKRFTSYCLQDIPGGEGTGLRNSMIGNEAN